MAQWRTSVGAWGGRVGYLLLVGLWLIIALPAYSAGGATARPADSSAASGMAQQVAEQVLESTGTPGGLVVHLGCGDGQLTAALHVDDRYLVHGLDRDAAQIRAAREWIVGRGLYGSVAVEQWQDTYLPYVDNLAALVLVEDSLDIPEAEIVRVVAPGGAMCLVQPDGTRVVRRKPRPEDIDDWTHYLHDASGNAVAADAQVGPPRYTRWIAGPTWSRSHELNPSLNSLVAGGGRIFYIYDDGILGIADLRFPERWSLYARDAFSGKLLWKRPVPNWGWREWNTRGMWSAPLTLNRRAVTDGERVFVTLGYKAPLSVLDAATGELIRTLPDTLGTDEILVVDGTLLLCLRDPLSVAQPPTTKSKQRLNPNEWNLQPPGPGVLAAFDARTGEPLWRLEPQPVGVLTLAAAAGRVCFYGEKEILCLDGRTGRQMWSTACRPQRGAKEARGTLVLYRDTVLFTSADGILALSAQDGSQRWSSPKSVGPGISHPPDLFVAKGLVWGGNDGQQQRRDQTAVEREGRDPVTGEVKRKVEVPQLISPLHHFRCYRSKATDRYLLLPKRGVEFLDLEGDDHSRNDWLRAMCHYGVMPCNGLLYVPPSHCFCYPGVKLTGFLALAAHDARGSTATPAAESLQQGPAFGAAWQPEPPTAADWPTYRHDATRSGHTTEAVPEMLISLWQTDLGGRVSQAVSSADRVFVAAIDAHQVVCLASGDGRMLWRFTAGARVDSPPTVYRGHVLFGCRDGWVYCLRATDGELVWRFRAAPEDRRIVAFEQLESPWPVPGNVLVQDRVAYVSAGRSSFLDGGVFLYALDPETGRVLHSRKVEGPRPDVQTEMGRPFDMDGTKSDILVSDGTYLYLYQMAFDKELNDVTPPRASELGDRVLGRRLIATGGLLDDSWWDRIYWMYGSRWPGFYFADKSPNAGQILVFDDDTVYGLHVFTERLRLSPAFTPGTGYTLFARDAEDEPELLPNSINREKGPGFTTAKTPKWQQRISLRARAMVLAGDVLFVAGPPDVMPSDDPYAAFDGRLGANLWAVSAAAGHRLAEYRLRSVPIFDGLSAAAGRLYLATADGQIQCFAGGQ